MNYRKLYDTLLETDELKIMFPKFKGDWEHDKKLFIDYQKKLEVEILKLEVQEDDDI